MFSRFALSRHWGRMFSSASPQAIPERMNFSCHNKESVKVILADTDKFLGKSVVVGGWVRTGRLANKNTLGFIELSDGSCFSSLQVILPNLANLNDLTATGASLLLRGDIVASPPNKKQKVEMHVKDILHFGPSDRTTYPVSKTALSLEFLRTQTHLRARTNTISAATRVRNTLFNATHEFFQRNGFQHIATPILTASDCEGAGSMFQVRIAGWKR